MKKYFLDYSAKQIEEGIDNAIRIANNPKLKVVTDRDFGGFMLLNNDNEVDAVYDAAKKMQSSPDIFIFDEYDHIIHCNVPCIVDKMLQDYSYLSEYGAKSLDFYPWGYDAGSLSITNIDIDSEVVSSNWMVYANF